MSIRRQNLKLFRKYRVETSLKLDSQRKIFWYFYQKRFKIFLLFDAKLRFALFRLASLSYFYPEKRSPSPTQKISNTFSRSDLPIHRLFVSLRLWTRQAIPDASSIPAAWSARRTARRRWVIVLGSEKASNLSTTQFSSAEIKTNLNKNLRK